MIHRVIAAAAFLMLASPSLHAAVGRTAGDGGTSASGEATYKIPIRVPPGINGVTPELALAYSHRNTEGTAGVGWDVSGLSAIVRCADTLAQNGGSDAVSLTTYDEYCVDGNQLRLTSGTQGTAGSKYRSEVDDITRYTAYGTAGNGPQYFIAEAKSGLIYYYGNSTNSRIESLASGFTTTVLVWNLSKIVDRSGNEIVFTWQEDGAPDGEYRILTIDYGGNAGQGVSARYRVNFQYGGLPASDIEMRYAAGGKLEETKRLTEIKVWYTEPATDELYRSYTLAYESDVSSTGRGRLANVQECAGNTGNCFEPTTFSYWDGDNDLDSEQYSGSTISGTNALSVDINGDGHTDLVYASGGTWWYQLANPAGAYLSAINSGISATSHTEAIAIDYNSDGLEDILVPSGGYWTAILGSATYPHLLSPVTTNAPDASNAGNAAALDLNGDGRDDLVWGENIGAINSRIRARYRDDTGFSTTLYSLFTGSASWYVAGPTLFGSPYRQGRNNFFDVNGDGLADVTYVSVQVVQQGGEPIDKYYTDVYLGGFRGIYSVTTAPSGLTSGLSIDMNGDGYTDVVYRLGNGNLKFR
ncbi:MAG TPA: FG-GAP-like repeat-containing protein, partial [Woeseiaceae bacterium]|nr:FG-GAP-like repeat-containing protein [Woeseiaceae bacterium]